MELCKKVSDLQITYIGGGSRGWAWQLMSDLAGDEEISGTLRLYDIDHEAALHNEKIGNALREREDAKGKWEYKAVDHLEDALKGAHFVVISILPGTFDEMASDVHSPEAYGIYQSVGDTVGPGGIIRGLRTVPMFVEIAKQIEKHCPDAWVINYTNPMTLCVQTLYKVFPKIKAFGCCHEVFHTQNLLGEALKEATEIQEVKREDVKVNVKGINHFTWIDEASYKNIDLMPIYTEFVARYYEEGYEGEKTGSWMNVFFASANRVKFDLFKRYGLIAAAGDRHLAEFVSGKWYIKDPETVKSWKFGLTPVEWRKEDLKKRLERSEKLVSGEETFEIRHSGEEGVRQIKALIGLGDLVTNVNVPNEGQISNLPLGAVVETNALFKKDGVKPVIAGPLPPAIQGICSRHLANIELTLEAALECDRSKALLAFVNDPLVTIPIDEAEKLFDTMINATKAFLPGWNL